MSDYNSETVGIGPDQTINAALADTHLSPESRTGGES